MVTRATAGAVRDVVVAAIDPLEIVLFGSVATRAAGNDLDLLIVTDDRDAARSADAAGALRTVLRPIKRRIDVDHYLVTCSQLAARLRSGSVFLRKIVSEGVCIYMREGIEAWRRQAEDELRTAEYLHAGGFHRGACYHAQQCVETSIKTMLLARGWELEELHNIHRLTAVAEEYRLPFRLQPDDVDFIDEIYRGRDPAESGLLPLGDPTAADAGRAVALAVRTVGALRGMLRPPR